MLFLKNTPIDQILSMSEMIDTIEDTLKKSPRGAAMNCRADGFTIRTG